MKKLSDLKKVFSNQEPEGQGCGIIMGVTRLLLLEPFYTIQTQKAQTFLGGVHILTRVNYFVHFAMKYPAYEFFNNLDDVGTMWKQGTFSFERVIMTNVYLCITFYSNSTH